MALHACPECNGALSSTAEACPHCGFRPQPVRERRRHAPLRGRQALMVLAAYALGALGLMYALPNYAFILGIVAVTAAVVELRSGVFRRGLGAD